MKRVPMWPKLETITITERITLATCCRFGVSSALCSRLEHYVSNPNSKNFPARRFDVPCHTRSCFCVYVIHIRFVLTLSSARVFTLPRGRHTSRRRWSLILDDTIDSTSGGRWSAIVPASVNICVNRCEQRRCVEVS